ncbi:sarcosine oxidase subunit gamma family protein [Tropicimonas sp. TH_r6]|uniref:sarcosine oxidase subunit gamma n=1 Tax=Tropicimonas sp. TH_r6 TaxID=3082085 RepID=UPI0029553BE6|nr:sarcosine oxidase subunit gamma family protein [Tropicimonas sp. TH_r6]MDV7142627.1 sarcosine oxidase subunit gamma family protein [Tropicimonas sp. TH_r6]
MSEAVTALGGASSAGPVAQVEERTIQGMVTLRGTLSELAPAVEAVTGCAMSGTRGIEHAGDAAVGWMSPDELLLLVPYAQTGEIVAALEEKLAGVHHLAVDVSDARASFRLEGPGAREVLARLCPVDLSPAAFGPGDLRRTRLAQVPAAFWIDEAGAFTLVCFRSVARYAFDCLAEAASGEAVGFLA